MKVGALPYKGLLPSPLSINFCLINNSFKVEYLILFYLLWLEQT